MYHINCSSNQRHLFQPSGLSINDTCNFQNTVAFEKFTCLFCPKLGIYSKFTSFMLSLSFSSASVLKANSNFGTLEVSNLWKIFCGNKKYVQYLYGRDVLWFEKFPNWTRPMECAELIVTYNLHSNFFKKNNTYNIEIKMATFQYAELHFLTQFLKVVHENSIQMSYKWQRQHIQGDYIRFKENYKVFFAKKS